MIGARRRSTALTAIAWLVGLTIAEACSTFDTATPADPAGDDGGPGADGTAPGSDANAVDVASADAGACTLLVEETFADGQMNGFKFFSSDGGTIGVESFSGAQDNALVAKVTSGSAGPPPFAEANGGDIEVPPTMRMAYAVYLDTDTPIHFGCQFALRNASGTALAVAYLERDDSSADLKLVFRSSPADGGPPVSVTDSAGVIGLPAWLDVEGTLDFARPTATARMRFKKRDAATWFQVETSVTVAPEVVREGLKCGITSADPGGTATVAIDDLHVQICE